MDSETAVFTIRKMLSKLDCNVHVLKSWLHKHTPVHRNSIPKSTQLDASNIRFVWLGSKIISNQFRRRHKCPTIFRIENHLRNSEKKKMQRMRKWIVIWQTESKCIHSSIKEVWQTIEFAQPPKQIRFHQFPHFGIESRGIVQSEIKSSLFGEIVTWNTAFLGLLLLGST